MRRNSPTNTSLFFLFICFGHSVLAGHVSAGVVEVGWAITCWVQGIAEDRMVGGVIGWRRGGNPSAAARGRLLFTASDEVLQFHSD